jgi:hypothetical protein
MRQLVLDLGSDDGDQRAGCCSPAESERRVLLSELSEAAVPGANWYGGQGRTELTQE